MLITITDDKGTIEAQLKADPALATEETIQRIADTIRFHAEQTRGSAIPGRPSDKEIEARYQREGEVSDD